MDQRKKGERRGKGGRGEGGDLSIDIASLATHTNTSAIMFFFFFVDSHAFFCAIGGKESYYAGACCGNGKMPAPVSQDEMLTVIARFISSSFARFTRQNPVSGEKKFANVGISYFVAAFMQSIFDLEARCHMSRKDQRL